MLKPDSLALKSNICLTGMSFSNRLRGEQEAVFLNERVVKPVHLTVHHCCLQAVGIYETQELVCVVIIFKVLRYGVRPVLLGPTCTY